MFTGVVWGIWHAPIILQKHNFPEEPVLGIIVMIGATVALSPVYTYLTVRAGSVLAAAFPYGSFNGLGTLSLIYLAGGGNLLVAPVSVAGIGAGRLATAAWIIHDRYMADEQITAVGPLSPWGI